MTNIYVLLEPSLPLGDFRQFTETIENGAGRLVALVSSRLVIVDGDEATAVALQELVGTIVAAVGSDDVTNLVIAAGGDPELTGLIGVMAFTTPLAVAAAEAVRPGQGQEWPGFGCTVGGN